MTRDATGKTQTEEAPQRPSRSHSQLSDYLWCGWSYRLKRQVGVQERPSVWLPGGSAFHVTTEQLDLLTWADPALLAEQAENISTWEDVFEVNFETELDALRAVEPDQTRWRTGGRKTKDRPNGEDVEWWRQAGRDMIRTYVAWRLRTSDTLHIAAVKGAAGVEVEVTTSFGGVPVRGFVDRLFLDTQTGAYLVVDYKTGANPPKAQLQLGQYSVQLEAMIGAPVRWGAYYDARKGELSKPFDLSGYTPERLGYIYGGLDTSIRSNIFLPNMTQCFSCGMRDACVFQGGIEPTPEKK